MTLYEARKGGSYCVEGLCVEPAITRRLQALGLNDGTVVNVLNRKKRGALIVQVRGTRLALGKHISSSIQVSEGSKETARPEGGTGIHGIRAVENRTFAEGGGMENRTSWEGMDAAEDPAWGGAGESAKREGESREA